MSGPPSRTERINHPIDNGPIAAVASGGDIALRSTWSRACHEAKSAGDQLCLLVVVAPRIFNPAGTVPCMTAPLGLLPRITSRCFSEVAVPIAPWLLQKTIDFLFSDENNNLGVLSLMFVVLVAASCPCRDLSETIPREALGWHLKTII